MMKRVIVYDLETMVNWKFKFQLSHTYDWNLPLQGTGWKLILRTFLTDIDSGHTFKYNKVTLPVCRIGQRWGATRAAYRIQKEQCHRHCSFLLLLLKPKALNPGVKGQSPLVYNHIRSRGRMVQVQLNERS